MILKVNKDICEIKQNEVWNVGDYNVHTVQVELSPEFNGLVNKVRYFIEDNSYDMLITDNVAQVPYEATVMEGTIKIGVYGYDADTNILVQSTSPVNKYITSGTYTGEADNTEPLTPTDKQQMESAIQKNTDDIINLQNNKQDVLISGENIKTINNESILGRGNINIEGGGGGGTSNYNALTNKPKINNVELVGNKSLNDLGIQPKGNYLISETDPTVPSYVKNITQTNITTWNNKLDSEDLTDYVKNSNYADNSNFGVVKTNYNYGIQTENGVLYINRASAAQIISRHQYAPITPKNFDLALKLGMCDGVGEAWTEDEKLKAQERIGVSKIPSGMTLTADVVLEESVESVNFNKIIVKNYEKLIIYVFRPATIFSSGYGNISFGSSVGGSLGGTEYNAFSTKQKINVRHTMVKTDGTKFEATTEWVNAGNNINDTAFIKSLYKPDANSFSGYLVINATQTFPIGTHILIYTK